MIGGNGGNGGSGGSGDGDAQVQKQQKQQKHNFIVLTTLTKLMLIRYDTKSFEMTVCDEMALFSDERDKGRKPVRIVRVQRSQDSPDDGDGNGNGDGSEDDKKNRLLFVGVTCDDANDLILFTVSSDGKLKMQTSFPSIKSTTTTTTTTGNDANDGDDNDDDSVVEESSDKKKEDATTTSASASTSQKLPKQKKNIKGNRDGAPSTKSNVMSEQSQPQSQSQSQSKQQQKVIVPSANRIRDIAMSMDKKGTQLYIAVITEDNLLKAWTVAMKRSSSEQTKETNQKKKKNGGDTNSKKREEEAYLFEPKLRGHSANHLSKIGDGKQRLRNVAFSNVKPHLFYAMHTSRIGQPHVTVYNIRDHTEVVAIKAHNSVATDLSVSRTFVANDESIVMNSNQKTTTSQLLEREFLSFGIKNGLVVREVVFDESTEAVNRLVAVGEYYGAHIDPITCNNILLTTEDMIDDKAKKQPILRLASGSLDRSVGFRDTTLRSPFSLQLIMFAIVLLVSMLVFMLKSLFLREQQV